MTEFAKFPHILTTDALLQSAERYPEVYLTGTLNVVGTVKLHGTNAAIFVDKGKLVAQSRSRVITPENDHYGFAKWLSELPEDQVSAVKHLLKYTKSSHLFGEWIGRGIQKGVGVSQLPKQFVPFALLRDGAVLPILGEDPTVFAEAKEGKLWLTEATELPWRTVAHTGTFRKMLSCGSLEELKAALEVLQGIAEPVGEHCPYSSAQGVEGHGEGIVWHFVDRPEGIRYPAFKTKTIHHKRVKKDKKLSKPPLDVSEVWAETFCDERVNNIYDSLKLEYKYLGLEHTGIFAKAFHADITREYPIRLKDKLELKAINRQAVNEYKRLLKEDK